MADGPEEDDELLLEDEVEEESDTHVNDEASDEDEPEGEDNSVDFTFGDEAAPASGERGESSVIRELRERNRELIRENSDLRKTAPAPQKIEVGERPTLESCEYDEERLASELEGWFTRKAKADRQAAEASTAEQSQREQWNRELREHERKRVALNIPNAEEAEERVNGVLDQIQQAVIVKVADNSAMLIQALDRNPAKLAELSRIKDPLKMAAAVAKLEGALKVMPKRKVSEPEQIASGSASIANRGADKELARLEAEAERTGDRSKVVAYKRNLKKAA